MILALVGLYWAHGGKPRASGDDPSPSFAVMIRVQ